MEHEALETYVLIEKDMVCSVVSLNKETKLYVLLYLI